MNREKLREKAIKRYLNGESLKEIYQSLGKGKTWFFKWLKRYKLDGVDWAKEHSRRPHQSPKRIDQEKEQSSRPREFHPQPLTEPDVNLSTHPALVIRS